MRGERQIISGVSCAESNAATDCGAIVGHADVLSRHVLQCDLSGAFVGFANTVAAAQNHFQRTCAHVQVGVSGLRDHGVACITLRINHTTTHTVDSRDPFVADDRQVGVFQPNARIE